MSIFGKAIARPGPALRTAAPLLLRELAARAVDVGGTLLFSDSPEYVTRPGILYTDVVKGDARVLYYHVNETGGLAKVAVLLANEGEQHAVVHVTRSAAAPPGSDYLAVGRATQAEYFGDRQEQSALYLAAGERRLLARRMDRTLVGKGELAYGIVDFTASQQVRATVIMYPSTADPLAFALAAPVLPKDEQRLRGSFPGMDRLIEAAYNPRRDGPRYLDIGRGRDRFKDGVDATDGSLVRNEGNYGVLYRVGLRISGGPARLGVNPMGGTYSGAVRVDGDDGSARRMVPESAPFFGDGPADVALPDSGGLVRLPAGAEMAPLGSYRPGPLTVEMSPPGASNLPVRLVLVPGG